MPPTGRSSIISTASCCWRASPPIRRRSGSPRAWCARRSPRAQTCLVDASGYLFYGDALHLTAQGYTIVAHYIAAQLAAPLTLGAPGDLGLQTARQFGRTLSTRSDLYGRGGVTPGLKFYALGDYFSEDVGANDQTSAFDVTGGGATIGAEYGMPMGAIGIAANYSKPRVRFGNDSARINAHAWQVGAYASLDAGGLFGQAYAGYGRDHNRITRMGVIDDMTASPERQPCYRRRQGRLPGAARPGADRPGRRARLCQGQGRRIYGEWRSRC